MEDIEKLEKEAQSAIFGNDYKCALEKYNECLLLCEQRDLREDFKRLLGFRVMLSTLVQRQEDALSDSLKYVMLENHTEEGFWCVSHAMKKLEKLDKALEYLIQGYLGANEPCRFLVEIVHTLVAERSSNEKQILSDVLIQYPNLTAGPVELQTAVVQKLAEEDCWEGVSLLVTGKHSGPVSSLDKSASNCSTQKVPVGKLLCDIPTESLKHFGIELATVLLENGESVHEIEKSMNIPIVHIGVKTALETGDVTLLRWCFENYVKTEEQRNKTDKNGDSVLHIVAKAIIENEKHGIDILEILIDNGCSAFLFDTDGKTPIEYISTDDFRYSLINRATVIDDVTISSDQLISDKTEEESTDLEFDKEEHTVEKDFNPEFFIQRADELFQKGRFELAVADYIKASEVLQNEDEKAKLVNVHCSITECYLKLENFTAAFEHAARNLPEDSSLSKVQLILGRTKLGVNIYVEALEAFARAVVHEDELEERDVIIKHISSCLGKCLHIENFRTSLDPILTWLPLCLKSLIIMRLINDKKWKEAFAFFDNFVQHKHSLKKGGECIEIKSICNIGIISKRAWIVEFILLLVENNLANFNDIILKSKESYLKACVRIAIATGKIGLLELAARKAKDCGEQNRTDLKGNTILHFAVQHEPLHPKTIEIIKTLLEHDVNPMTENNEGKTARNLVPFFEKTLSELLKTHEERWKLENPSPRKRKKRKKKIKHSISSESKGEIEKADSQLESEHIITFHEKCTCKDLIENTRRQATQDTTSAIETCVCVLQKNHKSKKHEKAKHECLNLVVDVISSLLEPDIPEVLTSVSESLYQKFLNRLARLGKWDLVCRAVLLFREKVKKDALSKFAKGMSIFTMLQTMKTKDEDGIVDILRILIHGGANVHVAEKFLVQETLGRSLLKVLETLFEFGMHPKLLSVYPGDTPIHAALMIGLQHKGNFGILKCFIKRYNGLKTMDPDLNPSQVDASGNNVFHLVAKETDCTIIHGASKLLAGLNIPVWCKNKEGKLPRDYLKCDHEDIREHTDFNPQIFGNLSWEIQCTKDFLKAITNRKVHPPLRRKAVNLIIELGKGMRMKHLCKKITHSNPSGPVLYEIKVDKAVRIIWEKAIDISNKPHAQEVIRLWDLVLNHDKIHDSVQNIIKSYDRAKLSQPLSRCIKRNLCKDSHMENPQTFQCMNPDNKSDPDVDCLYHPVNPSEHEFSVIKFHDFSFDVASYINENPDMDVDFPFNVTHLEDTLINMSSDAPILLIGRSGTGKTTCCLYRIWIRYKKYCMHIESTEISQASNIEVETQDEAAQNSADYGSEQQDQVKEDEANENGNKSDETACSSDTRFRQIFITKNPLLCMEVQRNFLEFRNASSIGKQYPSYKNPQSLPVKLQEVKDFQFPLFIVYKNLLELLDNSIGDPKYFSRDKRVKIKSEIQGWSDLNKEEDLSKYRQSNSNFEIISEDELSEQSSDEEQESSLQVKTKLKRKRGKIESKKIMTYDVFEKEIWKRIKHKDCKYDPSLVYTEIMSFIKGSYEALESPTGFLNFEEYVNLGKKMAPMFTEERGEIYEMFKAYEQEKQQSSYIDEADITKDIYNRLTKDRNRDILVDEVYVDEAQDFTQAEICVLVLLCRNPNRIFLTGDTAQCIVRGTAFRFIDIKSLFHSLAEKHISRRIQVPEKIYHLPHNYRSHSGILNMASSVLELMEDFFPESYDKLEKDIGMLPGPKPVLLESNLRDLPLLLNATKRDTSHIELGAHQVILVFKEGTKEEAQCLFNKSLVMTIDRAKGLEFDDVLLFNFFRDSYANKEWRTVTTYLNKISNHPDSLPSSLPSVIEIQYENMMQRRAIAFDRTKHKVLNTELKLLYTAITRARANVWIFDEDKESREPMYNYFQKRGLVETNIQDFKTISFAKPSSNTEWVKKGECLFRQKRFEEAAKCYENGQNTAMAEYATARHREERASYLTANSAVQYNLLWATLGYLKCQRMKRTTRCLKRLSEYKLLAMLYEKSNRIKKAATVYGNNDMPIDQSRCLEQLACFGKALQVLVDKGHFEEAHRCLERYNSYQESKDPIPKHLESKDKINYKAAKYFGIMGKKDCMMTYAQRISVEKRIDVFKFCDFIPEAEDLLLQEGMDEELVELYMRNGNIQKALHHLYKTDPSNRKLRNECIIIEALITIQFLKERKTDLPNLNEIINDEDPDAPFKARAYLLRGLLTESQNDVYTALNKFGDEIPGKFECIGWIMNRINWNQIEDIQNILKVLGELNPPYRDLLDKEGLRRHDFFNSNNSNFYGFYGDVNDKYKVYPRQAPIALNICNLSREKIEVRLKGENVRDGVLDFVVKKTRGWHQKLEGLINSQKKTTGEQLQISTDKKLSETMRNMDRSEDSSTDALFQVVRFHMLSIELNFISQGVDRKRCEELLKTLVSFNAINTFSEHYADSSNLLCSLLRNFHDKVMKNAMEENLHEINEGIQNSQRNALKSFIEIILLQKAMTLEEIDIGEMLSEYETKMFNKYKKRYFFDFRKSKRNDQEIHKVRKKAKEDGIDIADKKGKYVLQFMARPLLETLENINKCDTVRACVYFNEFCFLLLKRDRFDIPWDIFLLLGEYIVTISNIYAIREHRQLAVIFPHSYISRMHYVETLFLKTGSVCELQKQESKGKSKQSKINLQNLICLLCGHSGKSNILKAARESKTAPKHVFERVLVLCIVVLCNMGSQEIYSDASAIIKELVSEVAYSLEFSKRENVLKQLQTSVKTSDFVKSLSVIEKKNGVCLKVCTWKNGIDIQNLGSCKEIESILKSFDLSDETLKAIQSPVKDPKIKEVSVEKVENTKTSISENTTYEEEFAELTKPKGPHLMDTKDTKQQNTCGPNVPPVHISSKKVSNEENFQQTYTILYQRIPEIQIRRNLQESIPGG